MCHRKFTAESADDPSGGGDMSREAIREIFKNTGVEALFITDPHNMWYLSGFRGGEGMVYISPERQIVITDSRYTESASRESSFEIIEENRHHRRTDILDEILKEDDVHIVGYEDKFMRCFEFSRLQNRLTRINQWMPLDEQIDAIRQVKSDEELALIARAEAIGDEAFAATLKTIKAGMAEREVAAELEYQLKMHGGSRLSFDTIIASGPNSSMPHAVPSERKLAEGDFVVMDFGCKYEGYCSDMTRTICIGRAGDEQKKIYGIVQKAQQTALDGIRAGMTGREADALARDVITAEGYGENFGHALGHGVGLYIHESPTLSPNDSTVLKKGMVESVEPGIYLPKKFGVRIEDLVVIDTDGVRDLSHSPKELIEI